MKNEMKRLSIPKALMLSLGLALTLLVPKTTTAQYGGENDFFAMDETILEEYFAVDNTYGMNDFGCSPLLSLSQTCCGQLGSPYSTTKGMSP